MHQMDFCHLTLSRVELGSLQRLCSFLPLGQVVLFDHLVIDVAICAFIREGAHSASPTGGLSCLFMTLETILMMTFLLQ